MSEMDKLAYISLRAPKVEVILKEKVNVKSFLGTVGVQKESEKTFCSVLVFLCCMQMTYLDYIWLFVILYFNRLFCTYLIYSVLCTLK